MDKVFIWRRVKIRLQASEKIVKIRAINLESAREKWLKFVDLKNMEGADLHDFYYDTWYKNALNEEPDKTVDGVNEIAEYEVQILENDTN